MSQTFKPLTHAPFQWDEGLPAAYAGPRLVGASVFSTSGEFGVVCIQEVNTLQYRIRYFMLKLVQQMVISLRFSPGVWHAQLSMSGHTKIEIAGRKTIELKRNQFLFLGIPEPEIVTAYSAGNEYHYFDASILSETASELSSAFSSSPLFKEKDLVGTGWANSESLLIVQDILRCDYPDAFRDYYLRNKVSALLFQNMLKLLEQPHDDRAIPARKLEGIYAAEKLISYDLTKHFGIPELCKRTGLNEFELKQHFRKVYGIGPYEYLISIRMQHARKLLEAGASVKQAAAEIGMRPSNFSVAFRNFFGFNAGDILK